MNTNQQTILIIGGVAGGATAAARLRRLDEFAHIIMFERGDYISYANCGLPYYIGDTIKDKDKLQVTNPEKFSDSFDVDVRVQSEVLKINPAKKEVEVRDLLKNTTYTQKYDKLILSPGANPIRPPLPGINAPNILTLRNIPDTYAIKNFVQAKHPSHAAIIGGGFIGIEMAENLAALGMKVTIIEMLPQLLGPLDGEMAALVHSHLKMKGIQFYLGNGVAGFEAGDKGQTVVALQNGKKIPADLIILSIGVKPEKNLAEQAGLTIGKMGGIQVNESLQTSDPNIYAIGDAIEVKDFVSGLSCVIPLAGPANKQARIAADNICGRSEKYNGTQATSIAKVFDLTIATTGNNEKLLKKFNIPYVKSITHSNSHAGYYPDAMPLTIKLLFTPKEGKILGAQIVGYEGVDKRIDVIASALRGQRTVHDLTVLELAYAPPYSSAKDPVNIAGYVAENIINGDNSPLYWEDLKSFDASKHFVLDVRTAQEYSLGKIPNAVNIPVDLVRKRIAEIPKDKEIWIYCNIGQRAYYVARSLFQRGYKVKNLVGGYKTYEYATAPQANEDIFNKNTAQPYCDTPMMVPTKFKLEIDAKGLACPGPIMKAAETLQKVEMGDVVKIIASDPGFYSDIQVWAKQTQNTLLNVSQEKSMVTAVLQKGITINNSQLVAPTCAPVGNYPLNKTMVVFSGDLDKAIAAFIIANGAAAMGRTTTLFFTFWGLNILRKSGKVKVKKSMIEKAFGKMMPQGAGQLGMSQMNMGGMGAKMIKGIMKKHNVPSLQELIESAMKAGVKIIACQMTMDLLGIHKEELIDGVEIGGVATFLGATDESNTTLFI